MTKDLGREGKGREALNRREDQELSTDAIVNLAELVLKNNNFEFNEKH